MTGVASRTIRRSRLTSSAEVADLLQFLLISELLFPSSCLWIVSPWVSDVPIIDNALLGFTDLNSDWGPQRVRLSRVLVRLAQMGTTIVLATRAGDGSNRQFLDRVRMLFFEHDLDESGLLIVRDDIELHEKGIAGDDFFLSGSMNLTWNGIYVTSELVSLLVERADVQRARRSYFERYGGRFSEAAL